MTMADIDCTQCGHPMSAHRPHNGGSECQHHQCDCRLGAARRDDLEQEIARLTAEVERLVGVLAEYIPPSNYLAILAERDAALAEVAEQKQQNVSRQHSIEILGKAIGEVIQDFRASGSGIEHSTACAAAFLREVGRLKKKLYEETGCDCGHTEQGCLVNERLVARAEKAEAKVKRLTRERDVFKTAVRSYQEMNERLTQERDIDRADWAQEMAVLRAERGEARAEVERERDALAARVRVLEEALGVLGYRWDNVEEVARENAADARAALNPEKCDGN